MNKSLLISLAIHAAIIWAAFNMPEFFDFFDKKEQQPIVTMEMLPAKKNTPRPIEKARPKKVKPKKKLAKVKPKSSYKKPKEPVIIKKVVQKPKPKTKVIPKQPQEKLLTQKQKSPVIVPPQPEKVKPQYNDEYIAKAIEKNQAPMPKTKMDTKPDTSELFAEIEDIKEEPVVVDDPNAEVSPVEEIPTPKTQASIDQSGVENARDGRYLRQAGGNRPPLYPVADRIRKNTGRVTVVGYVTRDGRVTNVGVERSSATPRMETRAVQAFSRYRFQKGQEGWVKMPFEYTLDGEARVISVRDRRLLERVR